MNEKKNLTSLRELEEVSGVKY